MSLCVFVCVPLYEFCTQKYSSSVQVVYSSTVYLYVNLYTDMYMRMSCLYEVLFSYIDVVFVDGRGPFRVPERKFGIFVFHECYFTNPLCYLNI
jgi:hypothetical protein